jgi:PadR family transcriptional regulator PadR
MQQVRKGSTRLAILRILMDGRSYGYELAQQLRSRSAGEIDVAEGNLYPNLHGLEQDGHIASEWVQVSNGIPARKYYHLTAAGRSFFHQAVARWRSHVQAVEAILSKK